ncbi:MAG: hypothetical protein R3E48_02005 [Burkholderiaceae bacterium]
MRVLIADSLSWSAVAGWVYDLLLVWSLLAGAWVLWGAMTGRYDIRWESKPVWILLGFGLFFLVPLVTGIYGFANSPRQVRTPYRIRARGSAVVSAGLAGLATALAVGALFFAHEHQQQLLITAGWLSVITYISLVFSVTVMVLGIRFGWRVELWIGSAIAAALWLLGIAAVLNSAYGVGDFISIRGWLNVLGASIVVFVAMLVFGWLALGVGIVLPTVLRVHRGRLQAIVLAALPISILVVATAVLAGSPAGSRIAPMPDALLGKLFVFRPAPTIAVATYLIVVTVLVAIGLTLLAWRLARHFAEVASDGPGAPPANAIQTVASIGAINRKLQRENRFMQNHFVSLMPIKAEGGTAALKVVFRLIAFLHRYLFNRARLGTIGSIHFARWARIPGRPGPKGDSQEWLLFLTNYDGDFNGYLGEFQSAAGVNMIWGATKGFPKSFMLFLDGARTEQIFKNTARRSQFESLVWYSAYPSLSVEEIERATTLREALDRAVDCNGHGLVDRIRRAWRNPIAEHEIERVLSEILRVSRNRDRHHA